MPKRSRSGVVSKPARVVAPTSVKRARSILTERAAGPWADDQVELEILHGRIEDFLDGRVEPVDLVDEEDIALVEARQLCGKIARLGDDRAGGGAEIDAEFAGDDLRERRLAETRRPDEEHMVECRPLHLGRIDEHLQVLARRLLAGEIAKRQRPDGPS